MGNKKPAKAQAAVVGAAGPPAAAGTNGPAPAEPGKGGVAGASGARGKVAPAGNNINGARAGSAQPAAAAAAANATARVDGAPAAPAPPLVPTTVTLGQVLQGSWPFMAALVIVPSPMPPSVVADAAASGARPASSQPGPVPAAAAQTGSGPAPPPGPAAAPPAATIGQPQSYSVSLDLNSTLLANPVIRHLFSRVFDRFPDPQPSQKASTLLTAEEILAERPALADTLDNLVEATRTLFVDPGSPSRAKLASDMVEDQLLDIFYDPPPFVPDDFTLLASPAAVPSVTSLFSEGSVPSVHEEHDEENEESDEESYCEDYLDDPPPDPASAEFLSELFFCVALWYLNGSFGREVDYALAVRWMAEGVRRFGIVPPENGEMGWRGDEAILTLSHLAHHGIGCPPSLSLSSRLLSLLLPDNALACYLLARSQEVYGQEVEYDVLSWGLDRYRRQHPTKPDPSLTQSVCGGIAGHLVPTDILYQLSSLGHFFPSLVRLACRSLDRRTITSRTAELESMLPKGNWTTSRVPLLYALSLLSSTDLQHHSSGAETAIPWLIQSAESGNGRAAYILGRISEESGTNVSGSEREWYSRSAAAGNPWGLAKLGCLLKSTELTRGLAQPLRAGLDERDRERGQADKLMSAAWVNGFVVDPGMGMGMGMGNLPPLDGKFAGAGAAGQPKNGSHSAQNTSHNGNQPPAQSLHDLLLPSTYPFSALSPTSLSLSAFSPSSPNNPEHLAFSVPGAGTLPSVLDPVGRRWIRHLPLDPSDIGSYIVPFPSITPSSVATEWLGTGVQSVEVGRGRARGSPIVPSNWLGGLVWGWGGVGNQSIGSANKEKDKPSNQNDWPACGVATEAQASDAPRGKGALPSPSPIRKGSTSSAGGTAVAQSSSASPSSDDGLPATPVRADEDRHLKDPDYASGSAQQHVLKPPLAAAAPRNVNSTVPQPPQLPSDSPVDPPSKIASVASDEEGTKKKTKLYRSPSHHRRSGGISTDDEGDASATNRFARSKKPVKGKQVLGKRTLMSRLRDTDVLAGASSPSASGGNVAAAGSTAVAGNSPAGWHTGSIAPSNVAINPHLQSAFLLLSSLAFSTHYSTAPPNLSSPLDLSNQLPAPLLRPLPAQLSTLVLSSPQQRTKTILTFAMARNEFLEAHRIALSFEDPVRSLYGYYRGFTTDPSAFRNAGIAECLVCAVVCFYACVYSSARLHSEVASGDGARSRKGGNPSAGGTTAPLTGERKPYYGPEVGRMAETVLCYLMDNCAGWPAEYTLWKWSNRTKLEAVPKSQAPSPAAELQRDQARIDSEAVFESSLLMKLGGWEKFRLAYEELGKVISKTSSGSDNGDGPTVSGRTKGATNSLPANEVDRLVERERQRLARYEALYLRGVCGLQLVGAFEASMAQRNASTSPADALREHPPLVLQPLKKDLKAKQKEQQMYWATAAADLEAYVREAGPDGKNGVDALYLLAYHRLVHTRDPKGFLTFFRAAQLAEPKRPPTWPPIQNAHLKNMLAAELKYYEGTSATKMSADSGKGANKEPLMPQTLRNVAWPVVDFALMDNGVRA